MIYFYLTNNKLCIVLSMANMWHMSSLMILLKTMVLTLFLIRTQT